MAKVILNDGTEEFLSPRDARAKVNAGEGSFPQRYKTRQMTAEPAKQKRKRRTKAEIEADEAAAEAGPDEAA